MITSMEPSYLKWMRGFNPDPGTGYILAVAYGRYYESDDFDFISIRSSFTNRHPVEAVYEDGKAVHVWTANSKTELEQMKLLGVDNIITDDPVRAREILFRGEATETVMGYLKMMIRQRRRQWTMGNDQETTHMRVVVQRVTHAGAIVSGELLRRIGKGFMILLGVTDGDTAQLAEKMAGKIYRSRIFEDENGKTNLSLVDVEGELLITSQFILYADYHKGDRPNFTKAGVPRMAESLYKRFMERCRQYVDVAEKGQFGADMKVGPLNDGPFTLMLDSGDLSK